MADNDVVVLLCTTPKDLGQSIADPLLEERLIACVNFVGPVRSRYVWQGAIEESEELLLVMKSTRERLPALRARLAALHPYDVPELLELDAIGGLEPYLQWVRASVAPADRP